MVPKQNRRVRGTIYSKVLLGAFALTGLVPAAWAFHPMHLLKQCTSLLSPVADLVDGLPLTRKILDRRLSKDWIERFDPEAYRTLKDRYLKMEPLELEGWGFPESSLAYLSALIERSTGMELTLADLLLDDPTHARRLQLLCRKIDFSKNLTSYRLEQVLERAYLLSGKIDLSGPDLLHMGSERVREIMKEHVWKEMAKVGAVDLYRRYDLLKKPGLVAKLTELYRSPYIKALLTIPTWSRLPGRFQGGLLPTIQFVRFKPEILEAMLRDGIDAHLPELEASLRRRLVAQWSYTFVQHVVSIWAGTFTFAYALGELTGMSDQQVRDWAEIQLESGLSSLRQTFDAMPPPFFSSTHG
jgi:hypothetical protein